MGPVEAEGDSIDAAIEAALQMLQVSREQAEIEIISNASRGLFGIGARKARVRATRRSPIAAEHPPAEKSRPLPDAQPARPAAIAAAAARRQPPHVAPMTDRAPGERAQRMLEQIIAHIGVEVQVALRLEPEAYVLELNGDSTGVLIGRRGQMLDALEYLLNRIAVRDGGSVARVVIDSQNYRARRTEALQDLARRMGAQAKKKRRPITLNAMSPRDRRIVHMILQQDPSLTTRSSGKGYFRRLIIVPEGLNATSETA